MKGNLIRRMCKHSLPQKSQHKVARKHQKDKQFSVERRFIKFNVKCSSKNSEKDVLKEENARHAQIIFPAFPLTNSRIKLPTFFEFPLQTLDKWQETEKINGARTVAKNSYAQNRLQIKQKGEGKNGRDGSLVRRTLQAFYHSSFRCALVIEIFPRNQCNKNKH